MWLLLFWSNDSYSDPPDLQVKEFAYNVGDESKVLLCMWKLEINVCSLSL